MRTFSGQANATRRGQSTAEYAILFAVVLGAIVAMQVYVKRGHQGRIKMVTDTAVGHVLKNLGMTTTPAAKDLQYEPYYAASTFTTKQDTGRQETMEDGGIVKRLGITETTERTGSQTTRAAP